jgi:hypothetical protein
MSIEIGELFRKLTKFLRGSRTRVGAILFLLPALMSVPPIVSAQNWSWSTELIDSAGSDSSLVADSDGNLHVSYYFAKDGQLKYGFRPVNGTRWFTMSLDQGYGDFSTRITVDSKGNPYICYSPGVLKIAFFQNHRWTVQQIDPGEGLVSYTCSIQVTRDGTPQVSWYVESGVFLRYAILKNGVWVAQTADFEYKPGKWNWMVLDSKGFPHISYVTIFKWQLRYASFDGKAWSRTIVDSPELHPPDVQRGMGNSLALDLHGNPMISYYDVDSLKFAHYAGGKWIIETIDQFPSSGGMAAWKSYRSSILLDREGNPHIVFVTPSGLEHAWWDGKEWRTRLILALMGNAPLDPSMAIDGNDNIYISYTDPADHSLRLAIGRSAPAAQIAGNDSTKEVKPKN